jgi:uncharacterized Zn finger protein
MLSSIPSSQKLIRIIDLLLKDSYEICTSGKIHYKQEAFSTEDWSNAADFLKDRLDAILYKSQNGRFASEREELIDNLIAALDNAGRRDEIVPIAQEEAQLTGNYDRLIVELINADMLDDAEQLIHELFEMERLTGSYGFNRFKYLLEIKQLKQDQQATAALYADEFFRHNSLASYLYMLESARKINLKDKVRENALHYLETGRLPWEINVPTGLSQWSLPDTGLRFLIKKQEDKYPYYSTLILIALEEGRNDDAVSWYDSMKKAIPRFGIFGLSYAEMLAEKIGDTHPEKSIEIWKRLAEEEIEHTSRSHYENAAKYFDNARIMSIKSGREYEFDRYMEAMRQAHRRDRNFNEVLGII